MNIYSSVSEGKDRESRDRRFIDLMIQVHAHLVRTVKPDEDSSLYILQSMFRSLDKPSLQLVTDCLSELSQLLSTMPQGVEHDIHHAMITQLSKLIPFLDELEVDPQKRVAYDVIVKMFGSAYQTSGGNITGGREVGWVGHALMVVSCDKVDQPLEIYLQTQSSECWFNLMTLSKTIRQFNSIDDVLECIKDELKIQFKLWELDQDGTTSDQDS